MDDVVLGGLLSFNKVILTSHQAFFTREAIDNIAQVTMQNLSDFFERRKLPNQVCIETEKTIV